MNLQLLSVWSSDEVESHMVSIITCAASTSSKAEVKCRRAELGPFGVEDDRNRDFSIWLIMHASTRPILIMIRTQAHRMLRRSAFPIKAPAADAHRCVARDRVPEHC